MKTRFNFFAAFIATLMIPAIGFAQTDRKQSQLTTVSPGVTDTVTGIQTGANVNFTTLSVAALLRSQNNTFSGTNNFTGTFQIGSVTVTWPASKILVGTTDAQTLTNKTLTAPTINGGALSGTFSGNPTLSGVPILSGLSGGSQVSCLGLDVSNNVVLALAACGSGGGGGSAFNALTGGTNTSAAMLVGTGASLGPTGSGAIDSTTLLTKTWASPAAIGSGTPAGGAFTTLSASSTVSGTGFSTYLASPPAIGGTAAAAGTFTSLKDTGVTGSTQCLHADTTGAVTGTGSDCGSGGVTFANPTATAGPAAVNGVATTAMRSDAAPLIQKATNAQFGLAEGDGVTLTCSAGVCSVNGSIVAGTTQTITATQWNQATTFVVTTAAQTLTLPHSTTISANSGILVQTIGQTVTVTADASDAINGGSTGGSVTIQAGLQSLVTTDGAGNIRIAATAICSGDINAACSQVTNGSHITNASIPNSGLANSSVTVCGTSVSLGASASPSCVVPTNSGTSHTFSGNNDIFVCTSTCTMTVPVPAAGVEYCAINNVAVTTVITLSAIGSSARYGKTDQSAYGTAGTGTAVSGGAAGDKLCLIGLDSTHYNTASFNGAWTMN